MAGLAFIDGISLCCPPRHGRYGYHVNFSSKMVSKGLPVDQSSGNASSIRRRQWRGFKPSPATSGVLWHLQPDLRSMAPRCLMQSTAAARGANWWWSRRSKQPRSPR